MICGLVDVEFIKLVRGMRKEENPLDKFYNANINLATGSQAMNVFRPEPALKKESKLAAMPAYTSWDKVDVQGEISLKALVAQIEQSYGAKFVRLFSPGDDKICVFENSQ